MKGLVGSLCMGIWGHAFSSIHPALQGCGTAVFGGDAQPLCLPQAMWGHEAILTDPGAGSMQTQDEN